MKELDVDSKQASADLRFVDELVARARARIDPHAFHYVHWGWIVLLWFPLENWLHNHDQGTAQVSVRVSA